MNRTLRAVIAVIFIAIIIFCAITLTQNLGRGLKADITDQKIYTLSEGTRGILAKLNQPIEIKLFYARTAAMKAPDAIRHFNNYYHFVRAILEEYVAAGRGMINLKLIDPRPFSDDEQEALRYGLKRFPITEEENFFFGLVIKAPFGASKTISFFSPDRQNFVEYDISYLIDTVITRKKSRIGILSSLPVMGDDVSGYMAQMMRLQGQQPRPSWNFVRELKQRYEVNKIEMDLQEIKDVDLLIIVHPKDLPEKVLFAIDQFVLKGGRCIVFVDPYCLSDQPPPQARMQGQVPSQSSGLNKLLKTWGVEMPPDTFAGDGELALEASLRQNERPQKLISFLGLVRGCFNGDNIISANLNQVRVFFGGALEEVTGDKDESPKNNIVPLLQTTAQGNTWKPGSIMEVMMMDGKGMMRNFTPGTKPVTLGCIITGKFSSSFPEGIDITEPTEKGEQPPPPKTRHVDGLKEASADCTVVVFTDVDMISDVVAYQASLFGMTKVGDNDALLFNTIENLLGSEDLVSIRTRGNYQRPFTLVDAIEREAERDTAQEEIKINSQIEAFQNELNKIVSDARNKGEQIIDASELAGAKADLELKIHDAKVKLREFQNKRRERIESLGNALRNLNMLLAPVVILAFAIILSIRRNILRRRYIGRTGD